MKTALVLSGGGARGAFEAGVIAALEEAGVAPDVVSGTSAGAVNAAAVAAGIPASRIEDLWMSIDLADVFRPRIDLHRLLRLRHLVGTMNPRRLLRLLNPIQLADHLLEAVDWTWLLDPAPLRGLLVDIVGGERIDLADDVVMTTSVVDATTGEVVRFASEPPPEHRNKPSVRVVDMTVDHVLASASIPLLFRPADVDGRLYWDAGFVANTPLRAALAYEPDVVFVVATGAVHDDSDEPPSFGRSLALVLDNLLRYSLVNDIDHAETVNELVRAKPDATKHREVEFVLIAPPHDSDSLGALLDFESARMRRLVGLGHRVGADEIERWRNSRHDP